MRASVENWATLGGEQALTGPIARGDGEIVARHRRVIEERAPQFVALFDALVERTRSLASRVARTDHRPPDEAERSRNEDPSV